MSPAFEGYLARLYTDEAERALFLADAAGRARLAGLREAEVAALEAIDRKGLMLAAQSLSSKRTRAGGRSPRSSARRNLLAKVFARTRRSAI